MQLFDSSCVAVVVNKAVKIFCVFLSWPLFPLLLIYSHIYPIPSIPFYLKQKKMEFKWTAWSQGLLTLNPRLFKGCSLTNPQHQDAKYHGRCKVLGILNQETVTEFISLGSKITADSDMKLKDACCDKIIQCIKKQRHHFSDTSTYSKSYSFSSSHVRLWELDHKESQRIDAFKLQCRKRL